MTRWQRRQKRRALISAGWIFLRFRKILSFLESRGIVYSGHAGNQQVEHLIEKSPDKFIKPDDDFLAQYAIFDKNGNLIVSNVEGKMRNALLDKADRNGLDTLKYSYADGSYGVLLRHFRKEFSNPVLRVSLPPFEYIWWTTLGIACVLCWLFNTLRLRKRLVAKIRLFSDVSEKVGEQKLDFQITIIGGNAELLLEDDIKDEHRKMVETIPESNNRAKQYVSCLPEASRGEDESFESEDLKAFFDELCRNAKPVAEAGKINLVQKNNLSGNTKMQKHHLLRAVGNVVQNAVEHSPEGGTVIIEGCMTENGWQIIAGDEGAGFSKAAILHATERLRRGDSARAADGHNGLGLWFASQVVQKRR